MRNGGKCITPRRTASIHLVERSERDQHSSKESPPLQGWIPAGNVVTLQDAETSFTAAIQTEGKSAFPLISQPTGRFHLGENDLALADLDEALRRDPDSHEALECRSSIPHIARDEIDEATADINRAIELRPAEARLFLARSTLLASGGRKNLDKALADVDRASQLDPSEPLVLWTRAYNNVSFHRRDQALQGYHEAIRRTRDSDVLLMTVMNLIKAKEPQFARDIMRAGCGE